MADTTTVGPRLRPRSRIGIDLGGTKIAGICLDSEDDITGELRQATPRHDYDETLKTIASMVRTLVGAESPTSSFSIGIAMPGSLVPASGLVQNANSTWLNGRRLQHDIEALLGQPVRCANDANCFALSEFHDGAAKGCASVFGVILGTGCGGGLISHGTIINGPRNIGGEWGHNPLPWPDLDEVPGPQCWCGLNGCLETWVSGPAIAADHMRAFGNDSTAEQIASQAESGNPEAQATLERHASRLARGLAHVVNIFDPEMIVLGGGLSNLDHLYDELPGRMAGYIFAEDKTITVLPPRWGDASGVRGAARLWPIVD